MYGEKSKLMKIVVGITSYRVVAIKAEGRGYTVLADAVLTPPVVIDDPDIYQADNEAWNGLGQMIPRKEVPVGYCHPWYPDGLELFGRRGKGINSNRLRWGIPTLGDGRCVGWEPGDGPVDGVE